MSISDAHCKKWTRLLGHTVCHMFFNKKCFLKNVFSREMFFHEKSFFTGNVFSKEMYFHKKCFFTGNVFFIRNVLS